MPGFRSGLATNCRRRVTVYSPAWLASPARASSRLPTVNGLLIDHIHTQRAAGKTLAQIAHGLNQTGTPTAHGGKQWWPSTVRAILQRT